MKTTRLEAFSDGVIAIIITIMVLELKVPHGVEWNSLSPLIPNFLSYGMSFVYLGIYWNNHHHMMHLCDRITGAILWANLHLLFWLSLIPFVTGWIGENPASPNPAFSYGFVLFMAAVAYLILQTVIIHQQGKDSRLRKAVGNDVKGKLSASLYLTALLLTFWSPWLSLGIYAFVALIWLVPDKRIEARYHDLTK
jgi:uncharacterized membrane protein